MRLVKWIAVVTVLLIVVACATTAVKMTVKRPAEVNMKNFKKIALGDLTGGEGDHANDLMDMFTTKLVNSSYFEAVVDRQNLKGILSEHKLSNSGLIDENSSAQLGQFLGAAALVFGRVSTDNYKETVTFEDVVRENYETKQKYNVRVYTRTGTYTLGVNVRISDVQTAKIIGVKELMSARYSTKKADNKQPAAIDVNSLYTAATNDISNQFMKLVVPYDVMVEAKFETDAKNLPELGLAIKQVQIGETNEALIMFTDATKKPALLPKIQAKAFYNLGLLQMYVGQCDDSILNLKEAYKLNPSSKKYAAAITTAKQEKTAADKLKQQTD
ncbi:MAG: CsgG/HfaB family protein [Candidatus Cloacimonadaceae bacterium]|nr:CsgG/HfaB family protein [Candidatus Cloacimonadaceae bacterium]